MKVNVKGGGPNWTALVRKRDMQVMVAFAGGGPPAFGMVHAFLRAASSSIPRHEMIVVELDADLRVKVASDIGTRFKIFERSLDRTLDDLIISRKGES